LRWLFLELGVLDLYHLPLVIESDIFLFERHFVVFVALLFGVVGFGSILRLFASVLVFVDPLHRLLILFKDEIALQLLVQRVCCELLSNELGLAYQRLWLGLLLES